MSNRATPPPGAERDGLVQVGVEVTDRRVFASALDWPGWSRSGRTEQAALEALLASAPRFALVATAAASPLPGLVVLADPERRPGDATTAFGAPSVTFGADRRPLTAEGAARLAAFVRAAWDALAGVAATAPQELRKGPRGGGRDRDAILEHVAGAEAAYARKLGLRIAVADAGTLASGREAIIEALSAARAGTPLAERGWFARYAARRIAWHAIDHAWEIEDRVPDARSTP
jgi:hypothetical protein